MDLRNKKIVFLGDSITEGTGTTNPSQIYWNVVAKRTGAVCHGYGIGGTRIARQQVPSQETRWDKHFGSRVEGMIPDADIVVVFGGTNDFGHGDAPLGSFSDRTEHTFFGAFHNLLLKLIEKYPSAQLVVMTPLHRLSEDDCMLEQGQDNGKGKTLEEYVNAIQRVAAFYGVLVLDLYRTSGMQPRVQVLQDRYMPDGLHPNDAGHELIARRLIATLGSL